MPGRKTIKIFNLHWIPEFVIELKYNFQNHTLLFNIFLFIFYFLILIKFQIIEILLSVRCDFLSEKFKSLQKNKGCALES